MGLADIFDVLGRIMRHLPNSFIREAFAVPEAQDFPISRVDNIVIYDAHHGLSVVI